MVSCGLHVLVQGVEQGDARGDVQLQNVLLRNIVQVLDQRPETVAVGGDDDLFPGPDLRDDRLLPIGDDAGHRVGQALAGGDLLRAEACVLTQTPLKKVSGISTTMLAIPQLFLWDRLFHF